MAARAKIFTNGGSQAVRLPKAFKFSDDLREVVVSREGRRVVLEPPDEWPKQFLACLGAWKQEIERPGQQPLSMLRDELG